MAKNIKFGRYTLDIALTKEEREKRERKRKQKEAGIHLNEDNGYSGVYDDVKGGNTFDENRQKVESTISNAYDDVHDEYNEKKRLKEEQRIAREQERERIREEKMKARQEKERLKREAKLEKDRLKEQAVKDKEDARNTAMIAKQKRLEEAEKEKAEIKARKERIKAEQKAEQEEAKRNAPKKKRKLSIRALREEIEQYGFTFSMSSMFKQLFVVIVIIIAGIIYYKVSLIGAIVIILVVLLCSTTIVAMNYRYKYHIEVFNESSAYMENLIYAFLKKPKIREALEDTLMSITDTRIEKKVIEAIDFIDTSMSTNLYEDAFAIIEEEFGCTRMKQIHEFLIKVEEEGGEYEQSLFVLLESLQEWIRITNNYQAEKQKIKSNMILSILLGGVLAGIINTQLPEKFDVTNYAIYQITTTIFISLLFGCYLLVQKAVTGSLLKEKGARTEEAIVKDFAFLTYYDFKKEMRKAIIISLCIVGAGVGVWLLALAGKHSAMIGGLIALAGIYNLSSPKRKFKRTKQRIERDIRKSFPQYLMGLALSLQTETVQTAIEKSFEKAPIILKPALDILIKELNENPSSYEPYDNFLDGFNVPEIKSGMKTFYAINNLGDEEASKQINSLIHRNNQANTKAEELKVEDELKTKSFLIMLPMILTIPFMIVSLGLLFYNFLNLMGTATNEIDYDAIAGNSNSHTDAKLAEKPSEIATVQK